jgi:23S rRNA (cytidine1920-2'-O)/16S rRNA (cytidine1409-2'-O)-methyltransferase
MKKRLDVLLVERGLAESRAQAQALVLAGLVPGHTKAGEQLAEDAPLAVESPPRFVSRGGEKLAHGLDAFGVDPAGRDALDLGASTGGFTDVLLQRCARHVVALDVGHGQIDYRIRRDPRVSVLERINARYLADADLPAEWRTFDLVTVDVSFISLRLILPVIPSRLRPDGDVVALVKPQFEAGRSEVGKRGIVRDDAVRQRVLHEVVEAARTCGLDVQGTAPSPIEGMEGNVEWLAHFRHARQP